MIALTQVYAGIVVFRPNEFGVCNMHCPVERWEGLHLPVGMAEAAWDQWKARPYASLMPLLLCVPGRPEAFVVFLHLYINDGVPYPSLEAALVSETS